MLRSLLYVSTSTLRLPQEAWKVDEIVTFSLSFNAGAGITGALMFTEKNFAQVLEGPHHEVATLMERITGDSRHTGVTVVLEDWIEKRLFAEWNMAYLGPHLFVERQFKALCDAADGDDKKQAAQNLVDLMLAFTQEWRPSSDGG